jgi:hypothetical protein
MSNLEDKKIILESLYKLEKKITNVTMVLRLENETHVPDLMTRIRILPSVAVVAQDNKVSRFLDGDAMLSISIKYLPRTTEVFSSIRKISDMIKRLPGVKSIQIVSYNKKKITYKGKSITF